MTKHQKPLSISVLVGFALLLAGSLSGCGRPSANASPGPTGAPVDAEVVAFKLVGGTKPYATVLDDKNDVLAYTSRLTFSDESLATDLRDKLETYDLGGKALLVFHAGIGCDTASGVELRRSGDDFAIRYLDVTEHEECVAQKSTVAVFGIDRADLPANPKLQGDSPDPAALGELVGFQQFGKNGLRVPEVDATEISQPDQAERFLAQFPDGFPKLAADVHGAGRTAGTRMFAFPVSGCRNDGAVLVVEPEQLSAVPTGGENVRCVMAEHYIAVFSIDADDVPVDARITAATSR
ncbi:hypothetical protein [Flindersiella endophytica]